MGQTELDFVFTEGEWGKMRQSLSFSPRQEEIARCLLSGMSDKEIAEKVGISVPTVRTHMSRLFEKFHADDRVELVLRFFQQYRREFGRYEA